MTEEEWLDIFSNNLVEMLKEAKMTQNDLAEETGLSRATINAYIKKRKMPGVKAIINIGYALDCDFNDLIDFGDFIH